MLFGKFAGKFESCTIVQVEITFYNYMHSMAFSLHVTPPSPVGSC